MKNLEDGRGIYELDDAIQVIRGNDWGVFGIIIAMHGQTLTCWGRTPGEAGNMPYKFQAQADQVMYIGKGRIRPLRDGESRRVIPKMKESQPKPPPQPAQAPTPSPQPQPETKPVVEKTPQRAFDPKMGSEVPQFGMGEAEDAIPKKPTGPQEEIDPSMLAPLEVQLPSASNPTATPKPKEPVEDDSNNEKAQEEATEGIRPEGEVLRDGTGEQPKKTKKVRRQAKKASIRNTLPLQMDGAEGSDGSNAEATTED